MIQQRLAQRSGYIKVHVLSRFSRIKEEIGNRDRINSK